MNREPGMPPKTFSEQQAYWSPDRVRHYYVRFDADGEIAFACPHAMSKFFGGKSGEAAVPVPTHGSDWMRCSLADIVRRAEAIGGARECEATDPDTGEIYMIRVYPDERGYSAFIERTPAPGTLMASAEQMVQSLFEHSPDAVYLLDLKGKYIQVNASAVRLSGYSAAELMRRDFAGLIVPQDLPRVREHFYRAADGAAQSYPVRIIRADGATRNFIVNNFPIYDRGQIVGVYGIAKDVTSEYVTEALLRKSISLLEQSQSIAHIGSWEMNAKSKRMYWSQESFRIFGMPPSRDGHVEHERLLEAVTPEDAKRVLDIWRDGWRNRSFQTECRIIRPNGEERIVFVKGQVNAADSSRMTGIIQDITVLKSTERQLLESEQRSWSIIHHHPDGVCALDMDGTLIGANPSMARLTGYSADELNGQSYSVLLTPPEAERVSREYLNTADGIALQRIDSELLRKDGQVIVVTNTVVPIIVGGQRVGTYVIIKDMTDTLETEELLRKSDKLKVVGQLAAAVAHEIRNPLTALKGFVKLLQTQNADPKLPYLGIIQEELSRIEFISSELLVLAKPQVSRVADVDVREVLEQTIMLLATQAVMNNIEIRHCAADEQAYISGDGNQLKQVFVNLLKNAIEASSPGCSIEVAIERSEGELRIRFADQGCGMPEEMVKRLGEPFYTTKEKGTGLGYMVMRRIIESHHGRLAISSRQGDGTTVEVILPTRLPDQPPQQVPAI
ncbi:PAS domain S-box protein [Paenibacillus methanolicus]|nr:PAS domain S-box protein [Paenibacillus methanolicus]